VDREENRAPGSAGIPQAPDLEGLVKGFCALLGLVFACLASAAESPAVANAELIGRTNTLIERALRRPEAVGLSVAVGRGDKLLVERGAGLADLEFDVPADAQTMFRIGSLTKQFTAAAILKLAERGKVGLDDDLHKYVPTFDTGGRTVTLRQLLHHTSGVPSYTSQPGFLPDGAPRDLTPQQLLAFVKGVKFDFEPGQGWSYSNTGYYLLGMVIESAGGKPYARFVQDEFFTPLGLARTRYGSERDIIRNRAQGYAWNPARRSHYNDALISMTTPGAAGALSASAGDLVRWEMALAKGRAVSAASFQQMISDAVPAGPNGNHYGFGLEVRDKPLRSIAHGGVINGFNSNLLWLPDHDLYVAVLSNSEALSSGVLAEQIILAATSAGPLQPERTQPLADSEAAVRRLLAELAAGQPDYDRMGPGLADVTRRQLPGLQQLVSSLGAIESVQFREVDLNAADVYDVRMTRGSLLVGLILKDGKVTNAFLRRMDPPE
jgi:D-alanyl-D-alanine carboxypeptidase